MGIKIASVRLGIDSTAATAGAAQFSSAMRGVGTSSAAASSQVDKLSRNMKVLFGGMVGLMVLRDMIRTMTDFNKTMTEVQTVTKASTENMAKMTEIARRLGATTRFTAAQAGEGMLFLSRASFDANEVIKMIPQTLNLATAASIELGAASDMVANTMHQFGLASSQTERAVDALLISANNANTNVLEMGEALKYAGTFAGSLGISLEETTASLGVMANMGIKGSMAGTQLRGVIAALIRPTEKAEKALAELGLSASDVNPAIHSLEDIFAKFAKAQETMADKTKFAGLQLDIFSRRPLAASLALTKMNEEIGESVKRQRELAGETQEVADIMKNTLFESIKALRSALEELYISTGDSGVMGAFKDLVDILTSTLRVLGGAGDTVEKFSRIAETLAFIIKVIVLRFTVLIALKVVWFFLGILAAVVKVTAAMVGLHTVTIANPWGALLTALSAVIVMFMAFSKAADKAAERVERLKESQKKLNESLAHAEAVRGTIEQITVLSSAYKDLQNQMEGVQDTGNFLRAGVHGYQEDEAGRIQRHLSGESPIDPDSYTGVKRVGTGAHSGDPFGAPKTTFPTGRSMGEWLGYLGQANEVGKQAVDTYEKLRQTLTSTFETAKKDVGDFSDASTQQIETYITAAEALQHFYVEMSNTDVQSLLGDLGVSADPNAALEMIADLRKTIAVGYTELGQAGPRAEDAEALADWVEKYKEMTDQMELEVRLAGMSEKAREKEIFDRELLIFLAEQGLDASSREWEQMQSLRSELESVNTAREMAAKFVEDLNSIWTEGNRIRKEQLSTVGDIKNSLREEIEILRMSAEVGLTRNQVHERELQLKAIAKALTHLSNEELQKEITLIRELITEKMKLQQTDTLDGGGGLGVSTGGSIEDMQTRLEEERFAIGRTTDELERYRFQREAIDALDTTASDTRIQSLMAEYDQVHELKKANDEWALSAVMTQQQFANAVTSAAMSVITGSKSIEEAFVGLLQLLVEMIIQAMLFKAIMSALGMGGASGAIAEIGGSGTGGIQALPSYGGAYPSRQGRVVEPFGYGGVVRSPTTFPMAGGRMGLMGEAGAEAIMPLTRLPSGDLGVKSDGSTGRTVVVNMNIQTGDADSFRKSRKQITRELNRGIRTSQT